MSMLQKVFSVSCLIVVGEARTIAEIFIPQESERYKFFQLPGISSLFETVEFQGIPDLLNLRPVDKRRWNCRFRRLNDRVADVAHDRRMEIKGERKYKYQQAPVIHEPRGMPQLHAAQPSDEIGCPETHDLDHSCFKEAA